MPEQPNKPFTFYAQTPVQCRLLLSEEYAVILSALQMAPLSAAEVAGASRLPLKRVHHRLTRLHGAGLVSIAALRPRSGRAAKLYEAAAQTFQIPMSLTSAATAEEWRNTLLAPHHRQFAGASAHHYRELDTMEVLLSPDEAGHLSYNLLPLPVELQSQQNQEETEGLLYALGRLRLIPQSAAEFERRLRELQAWGVQQSSAEREDEWTCTYLFALGILPSED